MTEASRYKKRSGPGDRIELIYQKGGGIVVVVVEEGGGERDRGRFRGE
jgi:hypothetical protein